MDQRKKILERLDEISNLPSFPNIVVKLSSLLENPETSTDEIVQVIRMDPVISSNILHLANTIAFNISAKISSITEAIVRIGFYNVRDIVLSISMIRNFPNKGNIDYEKFWHHSLSVAYATKTIEHFTGKSYHQDENLYMAGLLHDLGILVLDQFFGDFYAPVLQKALNAKEPLYQIENSLIGICHSEISAKLLERWNLPTGVIEAVLNIYTPHLCSSETRRMGKILHIANYACENQGVTNGVDSFPVSFSNSAWFELGLRVDDIEEIINEVNNQVTKAKAVFEVAQSENASQDSKDIQKEGKIIF